MKGWQPDSTAIRRLRVCAGTDAGEVRLAQAGGQLRQALEFADWPQAPGQSWVFIRQVQARGSVHGLAGTLVQATREQMQAGGGDAVVRFASLAELLAALLADLVRGQAPARWYWRRWSHLFHLPPSRALAQLLAEHLEHLPAVCSRLAQRQALSEVWLSLEPADARQVLQPLAWRSGLTLPDAGEIEAELRRIEVEDAAGATPPPAASPLSRPAVSSTLRLHWAPVLRALPRDDARFELALLLIAQQVAPLMLLRSPARLFAGLMAAFEPVLNPGRKTPRERSGQQAEATATRKSAADAGPSAANPHPEPTLPERDRPFAPPHGAPSRDPLHRARDDVARPHPKEVAEQLENRAGARPEARAAPLPPAPAAAPAARVADDGRPRPGLHWIAPDPDFTQFSTGQGGLLYLLNVLDRPEVQALMGENWERLPNGWAWLYRLGQTLALDESDPIVAFIAVQLGLEREGDLAGLPDLPAREELLALAGRWYGTAGLWQPDLLHLSARIQATPSHVDLYAPLSTVRLPVRLAGLDIDPGWLPWLGRVVAFHYD